MKNLRFLILMFFLLAMTVSCTQNNYRLQVARLVINKDLLVKYNRSTGQSWELIRRTWRLIADDETIPKSDYVVWVSAGTVGNTADVYRIDQKTGQTWKAIDFRWINLN